MSKLPLAIEQIVFARNYTIGLLDQTPKTEWFRQPPGGVSHVAWQVGHIAFSEYRLALWRIWDHVFAYVEKVDTPRPLLFQLDLLRHVGFSQVEVLHKNVCFAAFGALKG
jgi:hypothetical protein